MVVANVLDVDYFYDDDDVDYYAFVKDLLSIYAKEEL